MAQTDLQNSAARGTPRRALFLIAALALAGLAYAIARVDILRARIVSQEIKLQAMQENASGLRNQIATLSTSNQHSDEQVAQLQSELSNFSNNFGALRSQAEQGQRQIARSEALYLLRLANDQLQLGHDLRNGIDTLSAAETLLRDSDDAVLTGIHQQILAALTQLRALSNSELDTIQTQLSAAEQQAGKLKLAAITFASSGTADQADATLPDAGIKRGWMLVKRGLASLFTIQKTGAAATLLSEDEQILRRRHLQVLLLNARLAAYLRDQTGYVTAVRSADTWVDQAFDAQDPEVGRLHTLLALLAQHNIAPATPDLAPSIQALTRYLPNTLSQGLTPSGADTP